jgi:hypothetical protein
MMRQRFAGKSPTPMVVPELTDGACTLRDGGNPILRTRGYGRVRPEVRFERIQILDAAQAVSPFPEREEVITAVGEEAIDGHPIGGMGLDGHPLDLDTREVHLAARRSAQAPGVGQSRRDLQHAVSILGPTPLKLLLQHGL